jgi:hypothetical protein
MKSALAGVQDTMYPLVAPRELSVVTSEYVESAVFYTDCSLIEGSAEFAIHQTGLGGFGFKLSSPAGIFSAELSSTPRKMLDSNRVRSRLCCLEEFRGELIRSYMNANNCALTL